MAGQRSASLPLCSYLIRCSIPGHRAQHRDGGQTYVYDQCVYFLYTFTLSPSLMLNSVSAFAV